MNTSSLSDAYLQCYMSWKPVTRKFENPYPYCGYGCGFRWKTPGLPVTIPSKIIIKSVTNSFFTHFTYRFVSLCYPLICQTETCVEYCFVSCFVHRFICCFVIVSNIVSTIYMFEYTVYIVYIELYSSLASL